MKTKALIFIWVLCVGTMAWRMFDSQRAENWEGKPIYDETADSLKQLADAFVVAKTDHKVVLLQFGANWCIWCHHLHRFFETDRGVSRKLRSDFVVVMVDVNNGHNAPIVSRYGEAARLGIPAISVLNSEGKLIATASSSDFVEDGHYSSKRILLFLNSSTTQSL